MLHHDLFAYQFHTLSHLLKFNIPSCKYLQDMREENAMLAMPTKLPAALTTGSQIKFPAVCINFPKHRPPECATEQASAMDCLSLSVALSSVSASCHVPRATSFQSAAAAATAFAAITFAASSFCDSTSSGKKFPLASLSPPFIRLIRAYCAALRCVSCTHRARLQRRIFV